MKRTQLAAEIDAEREADLNQTIGYHSYVSMAHKYISVIVPKNASTRIKLTLHQFEGITIPKEVGRIHELGQRLGDFDTPEMARMLTAPEWYRFCFVRNPYDRLISAYKTQIGNTWNREYEWVKQEIKDMFRYPPGGDGRERIVAFRDFVRYLSDAREEVRRDGHFNLQTRILMPDVIPYDLVGRFERFPTDFKRALVTIGAPPQIVATAREVKNPTARVLPATAYDRELADIVYAMYGPDFERYGYRRDSWMFEQIP